MVASAPQRSVSHPAAGEAIPAQTGATEASGPAPVAREASRGWPQGSETLAQELQRLLVIDDRQWHALKRQRPRRAAEQLASALVVLLSADDPRQGQPTAARQDAIALVEHALGWLRGEHSDPGCPSHGR